MNKKRIIAIVISILLVSCIVLVGIKGVKFVQEKYHFLRDKVVDIDLNLNEHIAKTSHYVFDYSWIQDNIFVSHAFGALGSTNSKTYSNSLEAFEKNYELGQRVFEVDFDITNDYQTVCSHDEEFWRYNAEIDDDVEFTYDNFMNSKIYGKYTPLDYKNVIDILNKYDDVIIITDSKYYDKDRVYLQFSQLVNYAKEINPEVLNRLVPQIYNENMLNYVMNVHRFSSMIYTLYQTKWEPQTVASFCVESGIKYVTVFSDYAGEDTISMWNAYGINVAVHTVDEIDVAQDFLKKGVKMIYTDYLTSHDLH